jgi:HSP20 family protein
MYRSLFPSDLFAEMDRLQREMQQAFETVSPSIRGFGRSFPALNVGQTPSSVEIYAFAPGIDPSKIDVNIDRGVLTIEGERLRTSGNAGSGNGSASNGSGSGSSSSSNGSRSTMHIKERFEGRFRRVLSLPDDVDPDNVTANYKDGVLSVSIKRREAAQPKRIQIQ